MARPGPSLPALTLLLGAAQALPAFASTLAAPAGFGILAAEGTMRGGWILALVALACASVGLAAAAILNGRVRRSDTGGEKLQAAARQPAALQIPISAVRRPLLLMFLMVAAGMVAHRAVRSAPGLQDPWAWGLGGAALLGAGLSLLAARGSLSCSAVGLRLAAAAPLGAERLQLTARRAVTAGALLPEALSLAACAAVVIVWGARAWEGLLAYALGRTAVALLLPAPTDPGDDTRVTTDILTSGDLVFLAAAVLGVAWLGPAGVVFPLCIRAAGVLSFSLASMAPAVAPLVAAAGILAAAPLCLRFTPDQVPPQGWNALTTLGPWATLGSVGKSAAGAVEVLIDFRPAWACVFGLAMAPALAWLARWAAAAGARTRTALPQFAVCCAPAAAALGAASLLAASAGPLGVAATAGFFCLGLLAINGPVLALAHASPLARCAVKIAAAGYDGGVLGTATHRTSTESLVALERTAIASLAAARGIAGGFATAAAFLLVAAMTVLLASGGVARAHLPQLLLDAVAGLLTLTNPRFIAGLLLGAAAPLLWHRLVAAASSRAAILPPPPRGADDPPATAARISFADLAAPACFALSLPVLTGFVLGNAALAGLVCGFAAPGQFLPALLPARDRSARPPRTPHAALQALALAAFAAAPLVAGFDAQLLEVLRPAFHDAGVQVPAGFRLRPFDALWTAAVAIFLLGVIIAVPGLRPASLSRRKARVSS